MQGVLLLVLAKGQLCPFLQKGGSMLDFKEISKMVSFKEVLDSLNIPYSETDKELKTEKIIANKEKNMFFDKATKKGGSVIQFYSDHTGKTAKEAAQDIYESLNG
jgi:hypothetical protein